MAKVFCQLLIFFCLSQKKKRKEKRGKHWLRPRDLLYRAHSDKELACLISLSLPDITNRDQAQFAYVSVLSGRTGGPF